MTDSLRVGPQTIEPSALFAAVEDPSCGAVASFLGRVRSPNGGIDVRYLEYEGYVELAEKTLGDIVAELRLLHGHSLWAIRHRLGRLAPGEISLAVVVATAGRKAAFSACQEAVEQCKARLPIWKLEVTSSGSSFVQGSSTAAVTL